MPRHQHRPRHSFLTPFSCPEPSAGESSGTESGQGPPWEPSVSVSVSIAGPTQKGGSRESGLGRIPIQVEGQRSTGPASACGGLTGRERVQRGHRLGGPRAAGAGPAALCPRVRAARQRCCRRRRPRASSHTLTSWPIPELRSFNSHHRGYGTPAPGSGQLRPGHRHCIERALVSHRGPGRTLSRRSREP